MTVEEVIRLGLDVDGNYWDKETRQNKQQEALEANGIKLTKGTMKWGSA